MSIGLLICEYFTSMEKVGTLQYDIEEVLGESTMLVKTGDGQRYVIKQIMCLTDDVEASVQTVKDLSKTIGHSYAVGIDDVFNVGNTIYLLCQYCEGGSLHALIKRARQHDDVINETEAIEWLIEIALVLHHLHQKGITYGQLNPKNILLANNCCKVSVTKLISRELSSAQSPCSIRPYSSPESISEPESQSNSSDVWALGCVLYELCALKKLFPKRRTTEELIGDITSKQLSTFPEIFSKELSDVWFRLMNRDPEKRQTLHELFEIPFISYQLKEMEELHKVESSRSIYWPDASSLVLQGDADSRRIDAERRDKGRLEFSELKDDNEEENCLTAEDIEYLLNPPSD